jgi:predicted kinase/ribosomal protein S18 acetylase RimI-like enzyme
MARLTVLCGLPGSGKSTLAKRIVAVGGDVRMCPDDWMDAAGIDLWDEAARARIEAFQWALAQELLLAGTDVVIEWGTWARAEREVLRTWCREHDVSVSLHHLEVDQMELKQRLESRNASDDETVIPLHHLDDWIAGPFQPPTPEELSLYDLRDLPVSGWTIRPWRTDDVPFLWDVLYLSIHLREGQAPPPFEIVDQPDLAHYLRDFGRRNGDDAQVAVGHGGVRLAAALCRRMTADDPGYGYVAEGVPELGMAVVPTHRGLGIGREALVALLARHPAISLSVDLDNVAARALYESLGFVEVAREGTAATMLRR